MMPSVLYMSRSPVTTEEVSSFTASRFGIEVFGDDVQMGRRCDDACKDGCA